MSNPRPLQNDYDSSHDSCQIPAPNHRYSREIRLDLRYPLYGA